MASAGAAEGDYLIVARVRRPHGVRGELLVSVETDRPRQVFRVGRELHVADDRGRPAGRSVMIEGARSTTGGVLLRLQGIESREGLEPLRGATLLIPASEAQPAASDEVHYRDLIGLRAVAGEQRLGTVADILEIGSGELLVLRSDTGREILVPFVKALVQAVDLERRELRLELPEGFLEI